MTKKNTRWSEFQNAIFDAVETILEDGQDLVVLARAGTGKTTTMVEAVIRFCRKQTFANVLTCAFNKKNAVELDDRLRDADLDWRQAQAKTLNSVGLATCKKAFGKGVKVDGRKGSMIAKKLADAYNDDPENLPISGLRGKVAKLATMVKITLTSPADDEALRRLCVNYAIAEDEDEMEVILRLAEEALHRARLDKMTVDFDDQLWFPHLFKLQPWKFSVVIVDEAQDMNASQLALARKSVKRGGRLIAVGDDRQAIYGWRGADSEFMSRMVDELGAKTLPLPRTYRCGQAIVREAQQIVPDYEAAEGNHEGVVRDSTLDKAYGEFAAGDFIISRANAPLLPICLELLKRRVPAVIQGRDVMGQLMGIVEKSGCETTECLLAYLDEYDVEERAKLVRQDAEESVIEAHDDRVACLRALAPERKTTADLLAYLDELFSDRDDSQKVTLSSAHRSKGLERDRVFLLADTFRSGGQEDNVRYVAITRAKNELVYLSN